VTFGGPHILGLVAEVTIRALKAVWYQKWFVHRRLRPEEYAGRVHLRATNQAAYPVHTTCSTRSLSPGCNSATGQPYCDGIP